MRRLALLSIVVLAAAVLPACQKGVAMWAPCGPGGDPTGTDGTYVLVCRDGIWQPTMTVDEYARLLRRKRVVLAPLPTRPPAPTTSTTSSTTSTSTTSTTSTTTVPAPTVTSVSPSAGPTTGGTNVTVTGTNLADALSVSFGGVQTVSFIALSDTELAVVTPASAAGTVDVAVTGPAGTGTAPDAFTYVAAPTVTSISPSSGPKYAPSPVTITGTGFTGATSVYFGSLRSATTPVVVSDTQITVQSAGPVMTAGTVDVTVTTPGGTSATSVASRFTYVS